MVAATADVEEMESTQPALVVQVITAGQGFAVTQHAGNQQAVSSSAMADLSDMEEVTVTADVDQQSSGEVKKTISASKRRANKKNRRRRKDRAYRACVATTGTLI